MSAYAGKVHTVKSARKTHRCQWCGQKIEVGDSYNHWLWFCDGDRTTVKSHIECYDYAMSTRDEEFAWFEGDGSRPEKRSKK